MLHVIDTINNLSTSQKETTHNQFLDGIRVGTRCIKNRDSELGHASNGYVVGTSTTASNRSDSDTNLLFLDLVGADQEGVGWFVGAFRRTDVVESTRKDVETLIERLLSSDSASEMGTKS